ncbi:MAG: amidohydrolase family protein [Schaalia hyovaginalis]|uniref:amidohydrolase family protein n=1 Tax=Schaalia hyovaginalis TaxID=29316 RepID=UPI0026E9C5D4|nr:amidohydrolase family protein [Schaalia hyovaginalis]MCI7512696.1 amidohydrolase family protein [Schaalia hyovaginalis]MDY3666116.1 amidohydrolase family protein [Schaalia hyovaginalis]MDY4262634.1 amidohydrolase family protein [Schaalia hyovaginalis]
MIFSGTLLTEGGDGLREERGTFRVTREGVARVGEGLEPDRIGFALPGFVDSHAHIGIGSAGPSTREEQEAQILAQRSAGVLAMRDCGSPVDTRWIDDRTDLPRLKRAGRHIARPKRYIRSLPVELDDPRDLPAEAARQAAAGGGWVKLVGDWIDRSMGADADLAPLWDRRILIDAVAAVHDLGAKVAVHAFARETIDDLLEAGVDDIEHASGMDEDQAREIAARGVLVTPTLLQIELFADFAEQAGSKFPVYGRRMLRMFEERHERFAMMREEGVRLVMGTDSGGYQEHGTIAAEFAMWEAEGVAREELLRIASIRSRADLGFGAPYEGGDLIVFAEDPRTLPVLGAPDAVVVRGELC